MELCAIICNKHDYFSFIFFFLFFLCERPLKKQFE